MTDTDITPAEGEIVDAEVVPVGERDKFSALPFESGIGAFYDSANDLDELLAEPNDAEGLIEYTGRPLTVHGASLHLGELEGKQTLFVVIDATDNSTGKRLPLTTGAGAVMRQLNRAAELGAFPFECMPYQRDLGRKGRTNPIHLGKADRF